MNRIQKTWLYYLIAYGVPLGFLVYFLILWFTFYGGRIPFT